MTLASAAAVTVDASRGNICQILLSGNASSIAITKPASGMRLTLEIVQNGATGPYTWVAPTAKWVDGSAPSAAATARFAIDVIQLGYDGTSWFENSLALNCH